MRATSHQDISNAVRKWPRPERNGRVYNEVIVAHMLTISTAAGSSSRIDFSTARPGEPLKTKPKTICWRSRIQDIPAQIQVHNCASIQLHCSVGTFACMSVFLLKVGGRRFVISGFGG